MTESHDPEIEPTGESGSVEPTSPAPQLDPQSWYDLAVARRLGDSDTAAPEPEAEWAPPEFHFGSTDQPAAPEVSAEVEEAAVSQSSPAAPEFAPESTMNFSPEPEPGSSGPEPTLNLEPMPVASEPEPTLALEFAPDDDGPAVEFEPARAAEVSAEAAAATDDAAFSEPTRAVAKLEDGQDDADFVEPEGEPTRVARALTDEAGIAVDSAEEPAEPAAEVVEPSPEPEPAADEVEEVEAPVVEDLAEESAPVADSTDGNQWAAEGDPETDEPAVEGEIEPESAEEITGGLASAALVAAASPRLAAPAEATAPIPFAAVAEATAPIPQAAPVEATTPIPQVEQPRVPVKAPADEIFRMPGEPSPNEPPRIEPTEEERKLAAERAARREAREAALAAPPPPAPVVAPEPQVIYRRSNDRAVPSLGFLLFRLVLAGIFGIRGVDILTDIPAARAQFETTILAAYQPGAETSAIITGVACLAVALALALGLLTRVAGLGIALIAGGALAFVYWGPWSPFVAGQPGFLGEYQLVLVACGLLLLCTGGGGWSLDRSFRAGRERSKRDRANDVEGL